MEGMMVRSRFRKPSATTTTTCYVAPPSPSIRRHSSPAGLAGIDAFHAPARHHHHSSACGVLDPASAASIWHVITPPTRTGRPTALGLPRGLRRVPSGEEGSWNAAWDVRPARWLHGSDSAWLLFGVCSCFHLSPTPANDGCCSSTATTVTMTEGGDDMVEDDDDGDSEGTDAPVEEHYKVTGVLADGRCLFRAVVYGACISSGKEAPDESTQRGLADQLRVQVAEELLKRRDEMEWSVEGDFDAYVQNIQQPWTWGGETELLMASHVLRTPISVFMVNKSSGGLLKIANYGHDYEKDNINSINVLFHGYGHYDSLEIFNYQT